jgi:hypothetical protein
LSLFEQADQLVTNRDMNIMLVPYFLQPGKTTQPKFMNWANGRDTNIF